MKSSYTTGGVCTDKYKDFWDEYRKRYFELKSGYREAYKLDKDF